jgi:hypothetical protein
MLLAAEPATCLADIPPPRHAVTAHNESHPRSPNPLDDIENDIVLAHDGKIAARKVLQSSAGSGVFRGGSEGGIDPQHAKDAVPR